MRDLKQESLSNTEERCILILGSKSEIAINTAYLFAKNGLLDLEDALFISKSPDNIDLAIKDFVILSKNLA